MTDAVPAAGGAANVIASRRLHPRGILARSWPALAIAVVYANQRRGDGVLTVTELALGIGGIVLVTLLVQVIAWRITTFAVDGAAVSVRGGLLVRQSRHLRLDRIQAVDVVRPLAARILGLSELRLEVAGAGASRVALRYLTRDDAEAVRARILSLAAGERAPEPMVVQADRPFYVVPNGLVLGSYLLSHPLVVLAIPVGLVLWQLGLLAAAAFGGFAAVALSVLESVRRATGWANFHLADGPDGLRIQRGLLDTRAQTVPHERVHAVSIVQPPLWRAMGWARVEVTIAGYGVDEKERPGMLLPVAPLPVALSLVRLLHPHVDLAAVVLRPIPRRGRWRAPIVGRWYGAAVAADLFVTRHGAFTRTTSVVPMRRVQSVHLLQGPWQRRLGLASVRADIAPGPVGSLARHLDAVAAQQLADLLVRLVRSSALERVGDAHRLDEPPEVAESGRVDERPPA
ncbi:MAG: rane-flanked domain [Frankiales bacterium]|nr:rane-flanked domain [Frankiales bacterium]